MCMPFLTQGFATSFVLCHCSHVRAGFGAAMQFPTPPLVGLNLRGRLEVVKDEVLDSIGAVVREWTHQARERHHGHHYPDQTELVNALSYRLDSILSALIDSVPAVPDGNRAQQELVKLEGRGDAGEPAALRKRVAFLKQINFDTNVKLESLQLLHDELLGRVRRRDRVIEYVLCPFDL